MFFLLLLSNEICTNLFRASSSFLQRITHIVYNYHPDVLTKIDSIRAVHYDAKYFADVNIGLPGSMPLSIADDIGTDLQKKN